VPSARTTNFNGSSSPLKTTSSPKSNPSTTGSPVLRAVTPPPRTPSPLLLPGNLPDPFRTPLLLRHFATTPEHQYPWRPAAAPTPPLAQFFPTNLPNLGARSDSSAPSSPGALPPVSSLGSSFLGSPTNPFLVPDALAQQPQAPQVQPVVAAAANPPPLRRNRNDMSDYIRLTPFYGQPDVAPSVFQFLDNLRMYLATKPDWDAAQKINILISVLRDPALTRYENAVARGEIAGGADEDEHLANIMTWLRQTFFTEYDRDKLQNQLFAAYQYINESPATFHARLCHMAQYAGLQGAVRDANILQVFRNGLHEEVKIHVMTMRPQGIDAVVNCAQGYWEARNPDTDPFRRIAPVYHQPEAAYDPYARPSMYQRTPIRQPPAAAPPTFRQYQPQEAPEPAPYRTPLPDDTLQELVDGMKQLKAHLANVDNRVQGMGQRIDFSRPARQVHQVTTNAPVTGANATPVGRSQNCHNCGRPDHWARNCPRSRNKPPRPCDICDGDHWLRECPEVNELKRKKRNHNVNVVHFQDAYDDANDEDLFYEDQYPTYDEYGDYDEDGYYAATSRRPPRNDKPYKRPSPQVVIEPVIPTSLPDDEFEQQMQATLERTTPPTRDTPMSESSREQALKKPKQRRDIRLNVWERYKEMEAPFKLGEMIHLSPVAAQQIRKGIMEEKPAMVPVVLPTIVNSIDHKATPAYVTCQVQGRMYEAIIDTGAGKTVISKTALDAMNWEITESTRETMIVANGAEVTPLGVVHDVPIQFGNIIIPISAIVTTATSYDFLLGVDWLTKANAVIYTNAQKMRINWKGQQFEIPVDFRKGVRPTIKEVDQHFDRAESNGTYTLTSPKENVLVKKLKEDVVIPQIKSNGAAGFDLHIYEELNIPPGESAVTNLQFSVKIPVQWVGWITTRSSARLRNLSISGIIDSDYVGPVHLLIGNRSPQTQLITAGERVAQLLILPVNTLPMQVVEELPQTNRNNQGFGSTGTHAVITDLEHKKETDKSTYEVEKVLTTTEKSQLHELIKDFEDIFATDYKDIVHKKPKYFHDIDTGNHPPIRQNPYRAPPKYLPWIRQELQTLLENGIVRQSKSPWASSIVIVPKKSGEPGKTVPRICIDYRPLNNITRKDALSLPRIDDLLQRIPRKSKYHSSLDALSGYHQIGLTPSAIEKSAFNTPDGDLLEYTRMPFGLCNAPATFQRMMNGILSDLVAKQEAFVYLDDVMICSPTWGLHLQSLREVFQRFHEHGLYLKPKKCSFGMRSMRFLGHVISEQGIATDPQKVQAMKDLPPPKDVKELRAALGLFGYYRGYIPKFSTIAAPLYRLFKKGQAYQWSDDCELAYRVLKVKLSNAPILVKPDFDRPFKLYTDASAFGFGAILAQDDDQKKEHVISYASRGTRGAEKKYAAFKLEACAVVWACNHYKHYLLGGHFDLYTDHRALRWLMTMKDPGGVYFRWILALQNFDMTIHYRPGVTNQHVDALSRLIPSDPSGARVTRQ
jgi:deoxyuridine 5'-triphosphate nucleotidohydrolase